MKLLIISLVLSLFAGAQVDTSTYKIRQGPVNWGDELDIAKTLNLQDSAVLVIKYKRRDLLVELFNAQMQLINSAILKDLQFEGKRKYLVDAHEFQGKIYFQFRQFNKKAKILRTIIEQFDCGSMNLIKVVDVFNTDAGAYRRMSSTWGQYHLREEYEMAEFGSSVSGNGKYKLFYTSSFDIGAKVLEKVKVVVFDSGMKKIREDDFVLPNPNGYFFIQKVVVDNSGNAYLLGSENYDLKYGYQKVETPAKYHLLKMDRSDSIIQQCPLVIDGVFMNRPDICFMDDGSVVVSGFYGLDDKVRMHGIYVFKIDIRKMEVVFSSSEEFDLSLIHKIMTKFESDKIEELEREGKKVGLITLLPVRVVPWINGDWLLLSEYGYDWGQQMGNYNSNAYVHGYVRGDIVIFKFDQSGTMNWVTNIDKLQSDLGNLSSLSYLMSVCEDKLIFIYNSEVLAGTMITVAEVDAQGEIESANIKLTKKEATSMRPANSIASAGCGFFLYFGNGKKYRLGIFDLVD